MIEVETIEGHYFLSLKSSEAPELGIEINPLIEQPILYPTMEAAFRDIFPAVDLSMHDYRETRYTLIAINRAATEVANRSRRGAATHFFFGVDTYYDLRGLHRLVRELGISTLYRFGFCPGLQPNEIVSLYSGPSPFDQPFVWAPQHDGFLVGKNRRAETYGLIIQGSIDN